MIGQYGDAMMPVLLFPDSYGLVGFVLWSCGSTTSANLQKMGYEVGEMGHPCLSQSPMKVNKRLKPTKWRASFDNDGKVLGFHKALRSIVLGGVDPSIRPEVWEFLLGCYTLDSTAEFRQQLREARRERYNDLIRQCQSMNANVGTGSLAHVVGSKVLDIRTTSKDDHARELNFGSVQDSADGTSETQRANTQNSDCKATPKSETPTTSGDLFNVRDSCDGDARDTASSVPSFGEDTSNFSDIRREANGSQDVTESYVDIPSLPIVKLFEKGDEDSREYHGVDNNVCTGQSVKNEDDRMHCFLINNNADLVIESNGSLSGSISHPISSEIKTVSPDARGKEPGSHSTRNKSEVIEKLKIASIPESPLREATPGGKAAYNEERVSEWQWILHQIVVDVVRTDSHLEFYGDTRNLARMSDILAVYAWVDPATGYCQGMSDLLSPFVVLYEDDADAFWCFEMLLRRMRENFQLQGPTGVMRQLEALWHILEHTDREMFAHLSLIGAESLHFAFRMLLVLFRRELTFHDALCMWEMIWAADFDNCKIYCLENNCLEALEINFSRHSNADSIEESTDNGSDSSECRPQPKQVEKSISDPVRVKSAAHPFCGLAKRFWSRSDHLPICNLFSRRGHDELPVYCVAAILTINRQKIIRETHSIDDLIKIFNDNMLKIDVGRCVGTAIKLRKKYFYKLVKKNSMTNRTGVSD
ncbi:hypothetical protein MLD38_017689 [Melastoma candidum]|uniref:Uncharacterized protein n=1 Tax=Melastoma candidum TaxID=119954 RepID=A0ACB9QRG8_9MYRT|nr:hypothetical protein MLD38_017689 [Melastoma candidum]